MRHAFLVAQLWLCLVQYGSTARRKLRMLLADVRKEHCQLLNLASPYATDFLGESSEETDGMGMISVRNSCCATALVVTGGGKGRGLGQEAFRHHPSRANSPDSTSTDISDRDGSRLGLATPSRSSLQFEPVSGIGKASLSGPS